MKAESTIRRELRQVEEAQRHATTEQEKREMYGAAQALAWALGGNYMAPHRLVTPWEDVPDGD